MTLRNLTSTPRNAEYPGVLEYAQENGRRCQDRESGMMPSRTARILAAEVSQAIATEHPWTYQEFLRVVKGMMAK
jgi:hypothetical protein